jgi:hypothetical protein
MGEAHHWRERSWGHTRPAGAGARVGRCRGVHDLQERALEDTGGRAGEMVDWLRRGGWSIGSVGPW